MIGRAIAFVPGNPEFHNNIAVSFLALGDLTDAETHFRRALTLKPDYAEAYYGLGATLQEQGLTDEALACCRRTVALKPDYAKAYYSIGNLLLKQGNAPEAVAALERAATIKPDYAEAHNNRGNALFRLNRFAASAEAYRRAVAIKPDYAEAHANLGTVLKELGQRNEAMACFEQALALDPTHAKARVSLCMAELPILYRDEAEIDERRAGYEQRLLALAEYAEQNPGIDFADAVGWAQPFYLAYQGRNDSDLQALYGDMVCRVMARKYPSAALPVPPAPGEKIRVGIVSGYFFDHSNWKIPIKGWIGQLDRSKFELFGYYTQALQDAATAEAATAFDHFRDGQRSIDQWRQAILADAPHVLIYPEIGMHPVSAQLAAQRLAPVQCNSWGHPDTSGFSTLDYYLSSDLMEPPEAQDHYTEHLIRLPNLSIYYEPAETAPVSLDRAELGLRPDATAYWCPQSLFKYLPQFDDVFPRIAAEAGDCQFVFIRHPISDAATDLFHERLRKVFAQFGLDSDRHCVFLAGMTAERFVAASAQCDAVLDSIGWSGCNSTLESLTHDLPVVTLPGSLMRGRHSAAILSMMGVTDTVAADVADYVFSAARLATDMSWRAGLKTRIAAGKHRLYRDRACIEALEEFLDRATRIPMRRTKLRGGPAPGSYRRPGSP